MKYCLLLFNLSDTRLPQVIGGGVPMLRPRSRDQIHIHHCHCLRPSYETPFLQHSSSQLLPVSSLRASSYVHSSLQEGIHSSTLLPNFFQVLHVFNLHTLILRSKEWIHCFITLLPNFVQFLTLFNFHMFVRRSKEGIDFFILRLHVLHRLHCFDRHQIMDEEPSFETVA